MTKKQETIEYEYGMTLKSEQTNFIYKFAHEEYISVRVNSYFLEKENNSYRFHLTVKNETTEREYTSFLWVDKSVGLSKGQDLCILHMLKQFMGINIEQKAKPEPVKEEPVKEEPVKEEEEIKIEPIKEEEIKIEPIKEEVKPEPIKEEVKPAPVKKAPKKIVKKVSKPKGILYDKTSKEHLTHLTGELEKLGVKWTEDVAKAKDLSYSLTDNKIFLFDEKGALTNAFIAYLKLHYGIA